MTHGIQEQESRHLEGAEAVAEYPRVKVVFGLSDGIEVRGKMSDEDVIQMRRFTTPRQEIRYKQQIYINNLFEYPNSPDAQLKPSKWKMKNQVRTDWNQKEGLGKLEVNGLTVELRYATSMNDVREQMKAMGLNSEDCLVITPTDRTLEDTFNSSARMRASVSEEGYNMVQLGKLRNLYSASLYENLSDTWRILVSETNYFADNRVLYGTETRDGEILPIAGLFVDQMGSPSETIILGKMSQRGDLETTEGPFKYLPEYKTEYPTVVTQALGELYAEYNLAFAPLVEANKEWVTDYQYCFSSDRVPINRWVQIDMSGLTQDFLQKAQNHSVNEVKEMLRGRIFEIENSLAMYQLLQEIFSSPEQDSPFKQAFRASLDALREKYPGKKVALLAVTDEKYEGMRSSEFGKEKWQDLTDAQVQKLSGFDRFFGPEEFKQYAKDCERREVESEYLLYVRSSDPMSKLKDPRVEVEVPLLANPDTRKFIKANAVTFNIDNPDWAVGDPRRINDTKAYLSSMGMAYEFYSQKDFAAEREMLSKVAASRVFRVKPMQASYGCYGHERGTLHDDAFWSKIERDVCQRGPYIIQPEIAPPVIVDAQTEATYVHIDRNFMTIGPNGQPLFMGGFRSLMPSESMEARRGRIHGNENTIWAEIMG